MATFLELQNDAYFWLGTTDSDAAFPRSQIKRLLNMAKDTLHEEMLRAFPDALTVTRTLTAESSDPRAYVFANQSPAIRSVALLVDVRLTGADGSTLTEVPFGERYTRAGRTYSLVGFDDPTLYTGPNVTSGDTLWVAYVVGAADLSENGDTPSWCPSRFHDVLSLMAARLAYGSGNEQSMSPILVERLEDRLAQLRFAFGQRSLSPRVARVR